MPWWLILRFYDGHTLQRRLVSRFSMHWVSSLLGLCLILPLWESLVFNPYLPTLERSKYLREATSHRCFQWKAPLDISACFGLSRFLPFSLPAQWYIFKTISGWSYLLASLDLESPGRHIFELVCDDASKMVELKGNDPSWLWVAPSFGLGSGPKLKWKEGESQLRTCIHCPASWLWPQCALFSCSCVSLPWWAAPASYAPKSALSFLRLLLTDFVTQTRVVTDAYKYLYI